MAAKRRNAGQGVTSARATAASKVQQGPVSPPGHRCAGNAGQSRERCGKPACLPCHPNPSRPPPIVSLASSVTFPFSCCSSPLSCCMVVVAFSTCTRHHRQRQHMARQGCGPRAMQAGACRARRAQQRPYRAAAAPAQPLQQPPSQSAAGAGGTRHSKAAQQGGALPGSWRTAGGAGWGRPPPCCGRTHPVLHVPKQVPPAQQSAAPQAGRPPGFTQAGREARAGGQESTCALHPDPAAVPQQRHTHIQRPVFRSV